ncbi:MAG: HNH endonuclease [Deltaproteobacteria bacterium]|nr:MAG: HNH endonuclease [Deltaproteobacteria bacterium]
MSVGPGGSSVLARLAIDTMEAWLPSDPRIDRVRALAVALSRSAAALDLRLARVCCWIQRHDLRKLGYGSFTTFVRERMCWQPSWQRQLARLLRSDLDLIKKAVQLGLVTLTAAVQAPGRVRPDQQAAWIRSVVAGDPATRDQGAAADDDIDVLVGDDAATVRRARRLARLLLGRPVPDRVADQQILDWFHSGDPPARILEGARAPRPAPDLAPASMPDSLGDQATPLVGPWEEPRDLDHALELADRLMAIRERRRAVLGRLLDQIKDCWLFLDWGHDRFDDFVQVDLDMSVRTAGRLRREGRTLLWFPQVAAAVDRELSLARVEALGRLADTAAQARQWLAVADRVPLGELQRMAADPSDAHRKQRALHKLAAEAPDLVERALAQRQARLDSLHATGAAATETGGSPTGLAGWTADARRLGPPRVGDGPDAPLDRSAIHVTLRVDDPSGPADGRRGADRAVIVPAGLLDAARWLLDHVQPPVERAADRVRQRSDHTCENPECRRRTIKVHVHHVTPRSLGGSDDPDNLCCLCPSCHLRLVHGGFMAIERVEGADVFLYPGRAVVVR